MNLPDEIFIVVVGYDGVHEESKIPVALETYLDERCSIDAAIETINRFGNNFGEVKIGRLVFDIDEPFIDLSDVMMPEEEKAQFQMT
jgi:hypothetical protein